LLSPQKNAPWRVLHQTPSEFAFASASPTSRERPRMLGVLEATVSLCPGEDAVPVAPPTNSFGVRLDKQLSVLVN
ncbi:hypothetical protein ACFLR0_02645, partial [Candidatus Bipolaricaulota bacterium]